jgi:hypothetical protein
MGMVGPNAGFVERDGQIWLYYNGWAGEHWETKAYRRAYNLGLWAMGRRTSGTWLALLRQEGFLSLDAGEDEGTVTTVPEQLEQLELVAQGERPAGARLIVNTRTHGPAGYVAAEVLGHDGAVVPGFSIAEADRFAVDAVAHEVTWQGKPLAALPRAQAGGEITLRFRLRHASLYSYSLA